MGAGLIGGVEGGAVRFSCGFLGWSDGDVISVDAGGEAGLMEIHVIVYFS